MKQRSTTPAVSKTSLGQSTLVAMAVLMAGAGVFQLGSSVFAIDYDAIINSKNNEKEQYEAEASRLGQAASTLQGALDELNNQVSTIRAQIADSQKKHDDLVDQIAKTEKQIQANRDALGEILSDLYIDDQVSPLEVLASSDTIGDYIDKQEQRASLRQSLNSKIKEVKDLKSSLENDKKAIENVLKDQESQRQQLAGKQAEQQKLVNDTKNDQNNYSALASERNAEISKLRTQQAEENLRRMQSSGWSGSIPAASSGNGGYPSVWANAGMDTIVDNWGLYNRECVSYVAWKVSSTGRYVPHFGGRGHAYQWPSTLAGVYSPTLGGTIQQGSEPRAGAAAIMYGGPYGHVMYVEAVNGDGTITVSDYNLGLDGLYRYYTRSASGLTYIYF